MKRTTRRPLATFAVAAMLTPAAAMNLSAAAPDYQSKYVAVSLSPLRPAFTWFALDSLGQGRVQQNPVLAATKAVAMPGLKLTRPVHLHPERTAALARRVRRKNADALLGFRRRRAVAAVGVQPKSKPRDAARADAPRPTAHDAAVRPAPAGHGVGADHRERARPGVGL